MYGELLREYMQGKDMIQKLIPVAVQEMIHFQTLEMEKEQTMAAKTYWKGEFYVCVVINRCSIMAEQGTHSEVETNHRGEREKEENLQKVQDQVALLQAGSRVSCML